jgi:hypothetical protein
MTWGISYIVNKQFCLFIILISTYQAGLQNNQWLAGQEGSYENQKTDRG